MESARILWADDEIEFLKPHILFLETKGYKVEGVTSGVEAIDLVKVNHYDLVFLDEHMPGMTGLETLLKIKEMREDLPVVMITKSEEEHVMEDAIGRKIADYLIKPVNPNQILHSIKKLLDKRRLVTQSVTQEYQQSFMELSSKVNASITTEEWIETYKKLVYWELELEQNGEEGMKMVLDSQRVEANKAFCEFTEDNYEDWLKDKTEGPTMSHNLLSRKLLPQLKGEVPVFLLVIDNLRYDQWRAIAPFFHSLFRPVEDNLYFSILPTTTQYARNALFSGMMPSEIEARYPNMWVNDEEEGGKNLHEAALLKEFLKRARLDIRSSYHKITSLDAGRALLDELGNLYQNKLNTIVYNFVDLLSHVRTEMGAIKELAEDEAAYRSLTKSWFEHSPLHMIIKKLSEKPCKIFLTTDHGSVIVKKASKIVGDRNTTANLRYKTGKNLNYNPKEVYAVRNPKDVLLPTQHMSSSFVFAKEDYFFVYPNNFNYFVNFYKETFQHGGLSIQEVLIPYAILETK